jgi:hypothetical protein
MTRLDEDETKDVQVLQDKELTTLRWQVDEWVFLLTAPLDQQQLAPMQNKVRDTLL